MLLSLRAGIASCARCRLRWRGGSFFLVPCAAIKESTGQVTVRFRTDQRFLTEASLSTSRLRTLGPISWQALDSGSSEGVGLLARNPEEVEAPF